MTSFLYSVPAGKVRDAVALMRERNNATMPELSLDEIAPVAIYFEANIMFKTEARKIARQLKKADHPLFKDLAELTAIDKDYLGALYNLAFLVTFEDVGCGDWIVSRDTYGAYQVLNPDTGAYRFGGDSSNYFSFYTGKQALTEDFDIKALN